MAGLFSLGPIRRFVAESRYRLISLVILLTGILLLIAGLAFSLAGVFLWLSTHMPSYLAALLISGGFVLVGAAIVAVAMLPRDRSLTTAPRSDATAAQTELVAEQMIASALGVAAETPVNAIFVAMALGVVVGLSREKDT